MSIARLSSLRALRVFTVAGRHLSFKLAAEELFISASAVSHQVRNLEEFLGIDLFVRKTRALEFTDAGGRVLTDSGARPEPPGAPPPPIRGTWEHPLGERLDTRWLHFNDDPGRPRPQD